MPTAWRLVASRHESSAFSGEGARRFGGRWNSPGIPIVYTSAHLSLAALEILVHVQPLTPRQSFAVFRVDWEDSQMQVLPVSALPKSWTNEPPGPGSMSLGDHWFRERRSPVLQVPSILIPEESNYLLNPLHPSFPDLKITRIRDFFFDSRLER